MINTRDSINIAHNWRVNRGGSVSRMLCIYFANDGERPIG